MTNKLEELKAAYVAYVTAAAAYAADDNAYADFAAADAAYDDAHDDYKACKAKTAERGADADLPASLRA
tara:strand:- start:8346 stop:8552 length:207 start_codon:yes stop_codon:yes gene_type:complete